MIWGCVLAILAALVVPTVSAGGPDAVCVGPDATGSSVECTRNVEDGDSVFVIWHEDGACAFQILVELATSSTMSGDVQSARGPLCAAINIEVSESASVSWCLRPC